MKMHMKRMNKVSLKRTDTDLILSSGLLAFSRHAGVIAAIEDSRLFNIQRVVGTSSGSLAGSMLAAGLTPDTIQRELGNQRSEITRIFILICLVLLELLVNE